MNEIQKLAYSLIINDAKFIFTLAKTANKIESNYISMALPYIGMFADGAEQWGKKVGIDKISRFSKEEKKYYTYLRNGCKLLDLGYKEFKEKLFNEFSASDKYYYENQSWIERNIIGYKNVGVDICNGVPCGNTILCGAYTPFSPVRGDVNGEKIKKLMEVAGKLCAEYEGIDNSVIKINSNMDIGKMIDYHFPKKCPIKNYKGFDDFVLYSLVCSINYIVVFCEVMFPYEFFFKLRASYLQYYYLVTLVPEINIELQTNFKMSKEWHNRAFRNVMAHYGLGQVMNKEDISLNIPMGGVVEKIFNKDYFYLKNKVQEELKLLVEQIENYLM